jgi:hypothetical protein
LLLSDSFLQNLHHSGQDDLAENFAGDKKKVDALKFLQFDRSPFLGIITITPLFQSSGMVSDVQMSLSGTVKV